MGKAARWIVGLALIAAVIGGAWWALQERGDVSAPRRDDTSTSPAERILPAATDDPELPLPDPTADARAVSLVSPEPLADELTAAPAAFTGRVVDAAGRPVPGAHVQHIRTDWLHGELVRRGESTPQQLPAGVETVTGPDGRFRLLVADHVPDHAPPTSSRDGTPRDGSWDDVPKLLLTHLRFELRAVRCELWRGGDFDAGDIALAAGVALRGRTVDEQGRPLAGVTLAIPAFDREVKGERLAEWLLARLVLRTESVEDGRFALDGFWAGPHRLELRAAGRRLTRRDFDAAPGASLDLGDVVLERGLVIEGVVVCSDGRPVPAARLLARLSASARNMSTFLSGLETEFTSRTGSGNSVEDVEAVADDRGAFRFDQLDPGQSPFSVYAAAEGLGVVRVDDVLPGGPPLRLELPIPASILLTVVDEISREPLADAVVEARRKSSELTTQRTPLTVSSDAAALKLAGLEPRPGLFLLTPASSNGNDAVVSAPGHAKQSFELPLVPAGERRELTVALARALRIAGRVVDPARKPIAHASVELREDDPSEGVTRVQIPPVVARPDARTNSAADGSFAFDELRAADWTVSASAPGFAAGKLTVSLKPGAPSEDLEFVLQPSGAIAGVVLRGGTPLAGAVVEALSVAQAEALRAVEKAKGGYNLRLDHLAKDVHQARADEHGRFVLEGLPAEPFELSGPPGTFLVADVRAGQTTEVTLEARAPPHVRGHVRGVQATRLAAIYADLFLDAGPLHGWSTSSPAGRSDADGNFDVELRSPGRYRIHADFEKNHGESVELSLDWDQVQWVELELPSAR